LVAAWSDTSDMSLKIACATASYFAELVSVSLSLSSFLHDTAIMLSKAAENMSLLKLGFKFLIISLMTKVFQLGLILN